VSHGPVARLGFDRGTPWFALRGGRSVTLVVASLTALLLILPSPLPPTNGAPSPPFASPHASVLAARTGSEGSESGSTFVAHPAVCSTPGVPSPGCIPSGWSGIEPQPGGRSNSLVADDPADHCLLLLGGQSFIGESSRPLEYLEDFWQLADGNWTELPLPGGFPSPLTSTNAQLVYDASDGYVLLAGYFPAFQTWSYRGGSWSELAPRLSPPLGVDLHMTYDAADGYVLFLGYSSDAPPASGALWSFHQGNWTNLSGRALPPPRWEESLVYDSTDGYVLMAGGDTAANDLTELENDTWEYRAGNWSRLSAAAPFPARFDAAMVDDPADHLVLLFGGVAVPAGYPNDSESYANDTWSYHNGTWTQLSPSQIPEARESAGAAYDSTLGAAVLFSGQCAVEGNGAGGCGVPYTTLADTWLFSAGNWSMLSPPPYPPSPVEMTYDGADGVVFAVSNCEPVPGGQASTWSFSHGRWTPLLAAGCPFFGYAPPLLADDPSDGYVLALAGNVTWGYLYGSNWFQLFPKGPALPVLYPGSAEMVYDGWDGYVLLFIGSYASGNGPPTETWAYHAGSWKDLTPTVGPSPPPRIDPGLAFNPTGHFVLLFGGDGPEGGALNDSWSFSGGEWTLLAPPVSPPAREDAAMLYDPESDHVILFAGGPTVLPPNYGTPYFDDTWEYGDGLWSNLSAALPNAPSSRVGASLVYDAADGYAVLVGDNFASYPPEQNGFVNATWAWNGSWARAAAPGIDSLTVGPNPDDVGVHLSIVVSESGGVGPVHLTYDGLPAGCPGSETAALSCLPTVAGTYPVRVNVTDSRNISASATVSLRVNSRPQVALQLLSTSAVTGLATNLSVLTQGGTPPFAFTFRGLPSGCRPGNRSAFNCTWSSPGNFTVSVNATDSLGQSSLASVSLTVHPAVGSQAPQGLFAGVSASDWLLLAAIIALGTAAAIGIYVWRRGRGAS
jgi:hypothetical protein